MIMPLSAISDRSILVIEGSRICSVCTGIIIVFFIKVVIKTISSLNTKCKKNQT